MQYLKLGLFPVTGPIQLLFAHRWKGKLPASNLPQLIEQYKTKGLRTLAKEYGVSHETIRRMLLKEHLRLPLKHDVSTIQSHDNVDIMI